MADSDTLDHRAELMRVWSADKALMAQAGLSMPNHGVYIGGKTAEDSAGHRGEHRLSENTHHPNNPHSVHTTGKKKAKSQKSHVTTTLTEKQTSNLLLKVASTPVNSAQVGKNEKKNKKNKKTKKQRVNIYIEDKNMKALDIDPKVTHQLTEYQQMLDPSIQTILDFIAKIPESYGGFKKHARSSLAALTNFASHQKTFPVAFITIADGLYEYVKNPPIAFHRYYKDFSYPVYNFSDDKLEIMQKGFLVHAITDMLSIFIKSNFSTAFKTYEEKLKQNVKEMEEHTNKLNVCFRELHKLKSALDSKAKKEKIENPGIKQRNLHNLKENIEEILHADGTFRMGNPYE